MGFEFIPPKRHAFVKNSIYVLNLIPKKGILVCNFFNDQSNEPLLKLKNRYLIY